MPPPSLRRLVTPAVALLVAAGLGACSGPARAHRSATTTTPHPGRHQGAATSPSTTRPRATAPPAGGGAVPAGFEPGSVSFVSSTTGFVIGVDSSCAVGRCVAVARTTDGGASWVSLHAPAAGYVAHGVRATSGVPAVSEVRFADEIDGWIWGPALFATHDGGASWQAVDLGGSVVSLEVSGGAGGWVYAVVSPCLEAVACSAQLELERAPATGGAFQTVLRGPSLVTYGGDAPDLALHAPGGFADLSAPGVSGPSLYGTSNLADAAAWRPLADPCGVVAGAGLVSFVAPDATELYSLCAGQGAAGSQTKWVVETASGHSAPVGSPPSAGDAEALAASPSGTLVVAAASGASYLERSSDHGSTWSAAATFADGGLGFDDLAFVTATEAVVVHGLPGSGATAELLLSRDGGAHWSALSFG